MKIQGKITIINSISIAISFFVFALGLFLYLFFFSNRVDYDYYSRYLLYNTFQSFYSTDQLEKLKTIEPRKGTAFVVFDSATQKILFTSSDEFCQENISSSDSNESPIDQFFGELMSRFSVNHKNFFIETIENHTLNIVLLFFKVRPCQGMGQASFNPFFWIFAISGTVIFVATFLNAIFLRKTSSNIHQLEEAMYRIANGDWNEPLKSVGDDELSGLVHSFNRMQQQLINERSIRYHFLMRISHDLKTPLTTIEGYLSAVQDGVILSEDFPKVIERILNKADLLKRRIFRLIDYVRMQTGEWAVSLERINLKKLLDEFIPIYTDEACLAKRNFETQYLAPKNLYVYLDVALISRLLENLINNALKYSFPYSTILLKVVKNQDADGLDQAQISIQNECEAIPQEQLKSLFEPFYRYSNARNESGFGLGLSIVKSIVDVHGWKIEVQLDGNKLEFVVSIPID